MKEKRWVRVSGYRAHMDGAGKAESSEIFFWTTDTLRALDLYHAVPGVKRVGSSLKHFEGGARPSFMPNIREASEEEVQELKETTESCGITLRNVKRRGVERLPDDTIELLPPLKSVRRGDD